MPRLAGWAAIAGGVLRIADSFTQGLLPQGVLAALYFATDVLLLAGIAGLWAKRRARLGLAGMSGLAVSAAGIAAIRAGFYQAGAGVAVLGLAIYAAETLITGSGARWAPLAWLAALAAGVAGTSNLAAPFMTALAGVAFGAGFVAAGIETLDLPRPLRDHRGA